MDVHMVLCIYARLCDVHFDMVQVVELPACVQEHLRPNEAQREMLSTHKMRVCKWFFPAN